jgi:uncharacterized protein (DUF111 family)
MNKKILLLDLSYGISLDMFYNLLLKLSPGAGDKKFSRKYDEIQKIIKNISHSRISKKLGKVYSLILDAEKISHNKNTDDIHFHEVGRDEAIILSASIILAIEELNIEKIICTDLIDGSGFIDCSHGRIKVPVPAVLNLAAKNDLKIAIDDKVYTEMLTPMALSILIASNAKFSSEEYEKALREITPLKEATQKGSRQIKENRGVLGILGILNS